MPSEEQEITDATSGRVLVADVGGTNTRLQLYQIAYDSIEAAGQKAPGVIIREKQYLNGDFSSFDEIVEAFLGQRGPIAAACLAVAGPVEKNAVNFTNRDWTIDGAKLEAKFGIGKVRLINDFVANGYGLLTLDEASECVPLQGASKVAGAPIACIGAGTGLGECFSTCAEPGMPYESFASEGGHADWAPRNALEVELLEFMKARFGQKHRVSVERVISGPGLATAYEFFSQRFPEKVVAAVDAAIGAAGEMKGKVIAEHSVKGCADFCSLCQLTMETFATAYGAEAGVAALKWIPLGGLYIAGGLTPKNLPLLKGEGSPFMKAFHDKGRLSPLLQRVPVYAVLAEDIGQRGAHLVAFRLLKAATPNAAPADVPRVKGFLHRLKSKTLPETEPLVAPGIVLVGDVGGTNTRLQLYKVVQGEVLMSRQCAPGTVVAEKQYLNGDFSSFDEIVEAFLGQRGPIAAACLAVAGPVEKNAVNFTNRDWTIDGAKLEAKFGIGKVRLINDFVANGYGLLTLDEASECVPLQGASKVAGAPIACIGAGTGLGECFSTCAEPGMPYESFASEGGHADWAPRNALEVELLEFMKARFGQKHRVSVERVISGPGLATAYEFFSQRFPEKVVAAVDAAIGAAGEMKGKVIAEHSVKGCADFCSLCQLTMETFATAYGAEAGVAALKWIPLGGLYIAGGLTPKNLPLLKGEGSPFMKAFHDKGRLSPLLQRVPVYAVLAEDIGQRGAHLVAFRLLAQLQQAQGKVAEYAAVKHGVPWKGSYERQVLISPTEILTKDPASGTVTNRWPRDALQSATPVEGPGDDAAARFVLKLLGIGPFCGLGATDLTFSVADKAQRDQILSVLAPVVAC